MEENDIELIERYRRGILTEAELADFRRRLANDTGFREAVQVHTDALEAIRLEGTATLRARLTEKGRMLDAQESGPKSRRWWPVGLAVLLLGVLTWWWTMPTNTPAPEIRDNAAPPASDTVPTALPPTAPNTPSKSTPKAPDNQKIFAAFFQPYKDPSLEPGRRGVAEPSPSERFQQLYWDGKYQSALIAFDSLAPSVQNNDNLLFLKANCLLATGRQGQAGVLLETILRLDRSRFTAQARWYLALSRLQTGRRKEADALLRQIAADTASPRRADAQRLLRNWQ